MKCKYWPVSLPALRHANVTPGFPRFVRLPRFPPFSRRYQRYPVPGTHRLTGPGGGAFS